MPVVEQLELGPIGTNCYLVLRDLDATEAIVVDPSGEPDVIQRRLAESGASCAAILITHGHWDHLVAVADLAEATGAPVYMAEAERILLENPGVYAPPTVEIRPHTPEVFLQGGETLELAGMTFEVASVPGHSPAHLAYFTGGALLSGDVLFAGSVGRTDLPGADWETLLASIRSLVDAYPPETIVYPGHGPATTLRAELESNPFLGDLRAERRA